MTDLVEFDERKEYQQVFRQAVARYETTPAHQILKRRKRYETVRSAYAGVIGSGGNATMPTTARGRAVEFLTDDVPGEVYGIIAGVLFFIAFIGFMVWAIDDSVDPLPKGVEQHGYSFTVPEGYAEKADSDLYPDSLCQRLPGYPDFDRMDERPDGSLVIHCKQLKDD